MKRSLTCIVLTILLFASFVHSQTYDREKIWEKEINAFAGIDRKQTPPDNAVLFVGSSSIRLWENLRESFPDLKVINRGFGGSGLGDGDHYFYKIVLPYKPKTIVLYAGENDISEGISPEIVAENYRKFAAMVHKRLPKTKIFYVSLKPSPSRWKLAGNFQKANELIKAETEKDKSAKFIDVWKSMLGANGEPMEDIFVADKLHMNEKGYRIWTGIMEKYLK